MRAAERVLRRITRSLDPVQQQVLGELGKMRAAVDARAPGDERGTVVVGVFLCLCSIARRSPELAEAALAEGRLWVAAFQEEAF